MRDFLDRLLKYCPHSRCWFLFLCLISLMFWVGFGQVLTWVVIRLVNISIVKNYDVLHFAFMRFVMTGSTPFDI